MNEKLVETTMKMLTELRSSTWNGLYEKAIRSNIPEEDCEKFIDFLYSKKKQDLYIPKKLLEKLG